MYRARTKKPTHISFDLIVIGSGAGGGVAALIAAGKGKRVAIIENSTLGGLCPNYACVPTKALLQAAKVYESALSAPRYGIRATSVVFNYRSVKAWKDTAVLRTGASESRQAYVHENIVVLRGRAHFIDPWTITLGSKRLTASHFLVATGSHDIIPQIEGLNEAGFITYREAIDLTQPPRSIMIIGGGPVGCEFAQIFSAFGGRVHIAESATHLLAAEDSEVGTTVANVFSERGVTVHLKTKVISIHGTKNKKTVTLETNGKRHIVQVEEILVATGKAPNTDLGLENAGVKFGERGIITNEFMESSTKHIYAAGDVTGPYMFTHTATYQSRIAAHNMFSQKKAKASYHAIPRVTFVEPEAAAVGATENELKAQNIPYQVSMAPISIIGRANTSNHSTGFVKVLASHTGVLLGASIVAPRAGELIHELTVAIHHGLKASAISDTVHAFPTWSESVRVACGQILCQ